MGELSTYYMEKAIERRRMDLAHLLLNYGASPSLECSTQLLEHVGPDLKTLFRNPSSKSEAFYPFLVRALESSGPLQELDDAHAIYKSLVRILQRAPFESKWRYMNYSKSNSDACICSKVVRRLLEAGLFRDLKVPARYWTIDLNDETPLTLAIYTRHVYAIRLLLGNSYNVDEIHRSEPFSCMEAKGTPLTYAVWLGFPEAVDILLEAGADVTKKGAQGQTATEMAKKRVSFPIAKKYRGCAKDAFLKNCKNNAGTRRRIFRMVCANLKTKHGMEYEDLINPFQRHV